MSEVSNLSPGEVARTLSGIAKEIDEVTQEISEADAEAMTARGQYERSYLTLVTSGDGAVELRKAQAKLDSFDAYFAAEVADQKLRALHSRLRALRDRLEVGRSISALVRMEWGS